jgi:hypothetical protein
MENHKTKHAGRFVKPGDLNLFHKTYCTFCWAPGSNKTCTRRSKMFYFFDYECGSTCFDAGLQLSAPLQWWQSNYAHQNQYENVTNLLVEGALTRSSSTDTLHMNVPTPPWDFHKTRIWKKLRWGSERKVATGHFPALLSPPPEKHFGEVLDKGKLLDTVNWISHPLFYQQWMKEGEIKAEIWFLVPWQKKKRKAFYLRGKSANNHPDEQHITTEHWAQQQQ